MSLEEVFFVLERSHSPFIIIISVWSDYTSIALGNGLLGPYIFHSSVQSRNIIGKEGK